MLSNPEGHAISIVAFNVLIQHEFTPELRIGPQKRARSQQLRNVRIIANPEVTSFR